MVKAFCSKRTTMQKLFLQGEIENPKYQITVDCNNNPKCQLIWLSLKLYKNDKFNTLKVKRYTLHLRPTQ